MRSDPITLDLAPDGQLLVWVPGANRGHAFRLPFDLRGLACLQTILTERHRGRVALATRGAPTQWDVEQWLRDHAPKAQAPLLNIELDL